MIKKKKRLKMKEKEMSVLINTHLLQQMHADIYECIPVSRVFFRIQFQGGGANQHFGELRRYQYIN